MASKTGRCHACGAARKFPHAVSEREREKIMSKEVPASRQEKKETEREREIEVNLPLFTRPGGGQSRVAKLEKDSIN